MSPETEPEVSSAWIMPPWMIALLLAVLASAIILLRRDAGEPSLLRVELGAPYDRMLTLNAGEKYRTEDPKRLPADESTFWNFTPWDGAPDAPVVVSYGLPNELFRLPSSTFVQVNFIALQIWNLNVKPLLEPVSKDEALKVAQLIMETFDKVAIPDRNHERLVELRDIDKNIAPPEKIYFTGKMLLGEWKMQRPTGTQNIDLTMEPVRKDWLGKQLYSLNIYISQNGLREHLERLKTEARKMDPLKSSRIPCPGSAYSCQIADPPAYLNMLRNTGLITHEPGIDKKP